MVECALTKTFMLTLKLCVNKSIFVNVLQHLSQTTDSQCCLMVKCYFVCFIPPTGLQVFWQQVLVCQFSCTYGKQVITYFY